MLTKYEKWQHELELEDLTYQSFLTCFEEIKSFTHNVKLQSLRYRLLQRILFFKDKLKIWKVVDNDNCYFCRKHKESLIHVFGYCEALTNTINLC